MASERIARQVESLLQDAIGADRARRRRRGARAREGDARARPRPRRRPRAPRRVADPLPDDADVLRHRRLDRARRRARPRGDDRDPARATARPARRPSSATAASSRTAAATGCWCASATRGCTRTTPAARVLSGLEIIARAARRGPGSTALTARAAACGSRSTPGSWCSTAATSSAPRRTRPRGCRTLAEPDTVLISDDDAARSSRATSTSSRAGRRAARRVARRSTSTTVRRRARERAGSRPPTSLTPFAGRRERAASRSPAAWRDAATGGTLPALLRQRRRRASASRALIAGGARRSGRAPLVCRCSGYHRTTSLHRVPRRARAACGIADERRPDERLAQAARRAAGTGEGDLPLLAAALSIPADDVAAPAEVDPSRLRVLALQAAAELVRRTRGEEPSILLVEDLHWADESTLDLLGVLLVGTGAPRPADRAQRAARRSPPPWPDDRVATHRARSRSAPRS